MISNILTQYGPNSGNTENPSMSCAFHMRKGLEARLDLMGDLLSILRLLIEAGRKGEENGCPSRLSQ